MITEKRRRISYILKCMNFKSAHVSKKKHLIYLFPSKRMRVRLVDHITKKIFEPNAENRTNFTETFNFMHYLDE